MKYFLLRPSVVDDDIKKKYSYIATNIEKGGDKVHNPLDEKWELYMKVSYEKDRKAFLKFVDGDMPGFDEYCLLRDLISITASDYLITPMKRSSANENAQFEVALASPLIIIQFE